MGVEVVDNTELNRYEARLDGELAGFAQYRIDGRRITLIHTEVDAAYAGHGVGGELARRALDDVRRRDLELVPRCPFIAAYVRRYPELYLDLVAEPLRDRLMAGA